MSAILAALGRLDDKVNPIAVKELRQAVQGRAIPIYMLLFLGAELLIIGGAMMLTDSQAGLNQRLGRDVFAWLSPMLTLVCTILVPALIGTRLAAERSSGETDLLYITTLCPRRIMWGKFVSAAIVNLMLCSVFAPFMTLTYLLRGIDVPSVLLALAITYCASCVAIMVAIFFAAIPGSRGAKAFHGLLLLGALVFILSMSQAFVQGITNLGMWSVFTRGHVLSQILAIVMVLVAVGGLFFVLSTAMISPSHSNRVMPIRIYLTLAWLAMAILVVVLGRSAVLPTKGLLVCWTIGFGFLFCITLLASISEHDRIPPRIKRSVPKSVLLRIPAFFFFGGAANGVCWSIAMFVMTLIGGYYVLHPILLPGMPLCGDMSEILPLLLFFSLYTVCYSFLGLLTKLYLLRRWLANTYTTTVALIVLMIGVLAPPMVYFLMRGTAPDDAQQLWYISNPFALFYYGPQNAHYYDKIQNYLATTAVALAVLVLPWMFGQMRRFTPKAISTNA